MYVPLGIGEMAKRTFILARQVVESLQTSRNRVRMMSLSVNMIELALYRCGQVSDPHLVVLG